MEQASPARLFATLAGAALLVWGIVGFFFDASFASPDGVHDALGLFSVNGWANTFHVLTGAAGLLLAGFASRAYSIGVCATYVVVGLIGTF